MNNFLIDIIAIFAIITSILVITSNNPVISIVFLICLFINIAIYLIILGIGFIGITYIIVYIGAIAILFLFVVIILNIQLSELNSQGNEYNKNLPLGISIIFIFFYSLLIIFPNFSIGIFNKFNEIWIDNIIYDINLPRAANFYNIFTFDINFNNNIAIQSIGYSIYTNYSIWLLIMGIILILAIIGPIILTIKKN